MFYIPAIVTCIILALCLIACGMGSIVFLGHRWWVMRLTGLLVSFSAVIAAVAHIAYLIMV